MPFFLPALKRNGFLDRLHITICNVGSRKLADRDNYASQGWRFFAPNLTIYGFDADEDACEAANTELAEQRISWTEKHIPLALSNCIGESTLYVTRHPMCSSLYPPDEAFLARFQDLGSLAGLDFTVTLETTTLDHFCQQERIQNIDFLQIDVQGADLQVLEGATQILNSVMSVEIEVEFSPLYANQPLFADVDTYLRKQQFSLFDLSTTRCVRDRSPIAAPAHPGQLLWGEAFYLRDMLQPSTSAKDPEQIFKMACIADALEFADYALELLEYLTLNYGNDPAYNFADAIVTSFKTIPDLVERGPVELPILANLQPYLRAESIA